MMKKELIFVFFLLTGWYSLIAQENDDYRLMALRFFCSNKEEIFKLEHPIFGKVSPIFLLDFRTNENEELYIDSNLFLPNEVALEYLLMSLKEDDYVYNKKNYMDPSTEGMDSICNLCECVYLDPFVKWKLDCVQSFENSNECKREFGLNISKVLSYKGVKCVILRAYSYYKRRVDRSQLFLVEYSVDGNVFRCGVGKVVFTD